MPQPSEEVRLEIGRKCLELYRNKNVSFSFLAKRFGIPRTTIKRWMRKAEMYESKGRLND